MNRKISHLLAGATLGAVASAGSALAGGEAGELVLRDFGSKFVGYSTEEGDGGSLNVLNAMFVQYLLPADRRHEFPVVMIHGGGGQVRIGSRRRMGETAGLTTSSPTAGTSTSSTVRDTAARRATPAAGTGRSESPILRLLLGLRHLSRAFGLAAPRHRATTRSSVGLQARLRRLIAATKSQRRRFRPCSMRSGRPYLSRIQPAAAALSACRI